MFSGYRNIKSRTINIHLRDCNYFIFYKYIIFQSFKFYLFQFRDLNKFRQLRNDSKYRGEDIIAKEAKDVLEMAEKIIPELKNKFGEIKK